MTNEQNNGPDKGKSNNESHHVMMNPQEFLNFLGHITQATVISAITAGSLAADMEKLEDLLKDGKVDEALKQTRIMKRGIHLITKTVCKIGSELTLHDQAICEGCEEKGMTVESVTATHIERFQADTKAFIDDFFDNTPQTKIVPDPFGEDKDKKKKKDGGPDPFSSGSRFN